MTLAPFDLSVFKQFAQHISDAVAVVRSDGELVWFNGVAKKFLHLNKKDLGTMLTGKWGLPDLESIYTAGESACIELKIDGDSDHYTPMTILPYDQYMVLIFQDIEHKLQVDKLRQDFVANVSHEMRTPLTVIQGYLEMMSDDLVEAFPMWQESISQMQQQFVRLETLLTDLLLLSTLQQHDLQVDQFKKIDMPRLIEEVVNNQRHITDDRYSFITDIDTSLMLQGCEKEITSCITNLITNAVRYSPNGGEIKVGWYADAHGRHFYVKDQGVGIDSIHIPRITERFYRVDKSRSRQTGGTGLGLSIVKHVLIRHHATLYIESKLGKGSYFRCDFP